MSKREIFEKFDDLSEDELNAKATNKLMLKMMLWLLLLNAAEVKKGDKKSKCI